ncbi:MAG TPA: electron transport complex subunit E [Tissierellaceae bacterium]
MNIFKIIKDGILKNNPVLVQLVGLCSVLAVTNTMVNSFSMGMAVTAVLVGANLVISLFKNFIPSKIRIPAFIVVIATFVTMIEMFLKAFLPPIYESLGIFIPLIVVNCIILARAEAFAYKNKVIPSIADGLGNGLGYTFAVLILGTLREIFGNGTILAGTSMEMQVFGPNFQPAAVFVAPAGAFILLGLIVAVFNVFKTRKASN